MTDRYYALTVSLERDVRSDDAKALIAAIGQLRGVLAVEPLVSHPDIWTAQRRARVELERRLYEALIDLSEQP